MCRLAVSERFVRSLIRLFAFTKSSVDSDASTLGNICRWKCSASACSGLTHSAAVWWWPTTALAVRWFPWRCGFWIVDTEHNCIDAFGVESVAKFGTDPLRETRLLAWDLDWHIYRGELLVWNILIWNFYLKFWLIYPNDFEKFVSVAVIVCRSTGASSGVENASGRFSKRFVWDATAFEATYCLKWFLTEHYQWNWIENLTTIQRIHLSRIVSRSSWWAVCSCSTQLKPSRNYFCSWVSSFECHYTSGHNYKACNQFSLQRKFEFIASQTYHRIP